MDMNRPCGEASVPFRGISRPAFVGGCRGARSGILSPVDPGQIASPHGPNESEEHAHEPNRGLAVRNDSAHFDRNPG